MSADSMNSVFILSNSCSRMRDILPVCIFNMKKDGHINETILREELFRKDVQR